jgi:molecular chaperone DnaK
LIEEASRNAEIDRRLKEVILARNRLEGLMQNTARSFSEFGWMLTQSDQDFVRQTLDNARRAVLSEDGTEVRYALEELERGARLITDAMFRPTGMSPGPGSASEEEKATPAAEMS